MICPLSPVQLPGRPRRQDLQCGGRSGRTREAHHPPLARAANCVIRLTVPASVAAKAVPALAPLVSAAAARPRTDAPSQRRDIGLRRPPRLSPAVGRGRTGSSGERCASRRLVEAQPVPLAPPPGPATRVHELFPRGVALEKPLVTSAACAPAALAGLAQEGAPPTGRCTCTRPVAASGQG